MKPLLSGSIAVALLTLGLGFNKAQGATFNIADGDVPGLISAINTANTNLELDTINLAAGGSYILTAADNTASGPNGLPVTLNDVAGADLTIHGNGSTIVRSSAGGTPDFRILRIGPEASVSIDGLTIANGRATGSFPADLGGGIFNDHGTVTLNSCTVTGNFGGYGGGILNDGTQGGSANMALTGCSILSNTAVQGGGIRNDASNGHATLVIEQSTISNNFGTSAGTTYGAGIQNVGSSGVAKLTVSSSTISGNHSNGVMESFGGGISNSAGPGTANIVLTNSTVSGNSAAKGGGIHNDAGSGTINTCTISGNTVSSSGAGIYNDGTDGAANLTIYNSTLSDNSASGFAGALYNLSTLGKVTLGDNIFKTGMFGGNVANTGTITSQGYNLSNDFFSGLLTSPGDKASTDPKLGPLGYNGGPTQTHALLPGSPAIDKGKRFGSPLPTTDQRGLRRPYDDPVIANGAGSDGSDIGALEAEGHPQIGPAFIVNVLDDHDDGGANACTAGDCTLREAINAANALAGDDSITFSSNLTGAIELNSPLPALGSNIQLQGPGASKLTVRRTNGGNYRVFTVSNGTLNGPDVTISGLTIAQGVATGNTGTDGIGGGIWNDHSTLHVQNCELDDNTALNGGGIYNDSGTGGNAHLQVSDCSFSRNSAAGHGGGIYNSGFDGNAVANVTTSTFATNTSSEGGAFYNDRGDITLGNSILKGNTGGAGGGISNNANNGGRSNLVVQNSTLSNNLANANVGGGIANSCQNNPNGIGSVTVLNSTFDANRASTLGGGISNNGSNNGNATVTVGSCTFSGNIGTVGAGALFNSNTAGGHTAETVGNSIFRTGSAGENLVNNGATFTSQGHNISNDAAGGPAGSAPGGLLNGPGDLRNTDPKLDPAGLKSNGGPTQTIALLSTSPAINKAANASSRDQRNYLRNGAADIGAFEFGGTIPVALGNISTRLHVGTGNNVLIGGFIITGTHNKKVLLRGIGPSLTLAGKLANPFLELHNGAGALLASNDDWGSAANHQDIFNTGIAPKNALESAILTMLAPGAYTAIVRGVGNGTGIGLVEGYDLDRSTDAVLGNISTRGQVLTGDNVMIGGFIVVGADSQKIIVRAIGPSLPIVGKLANPILELHNSGGVLVASNDNWRSSQETEITDTGIPPTNNLESAIVATLPPGSYTAIVRGVNNTTGIALVEVYSLE